MFEAMKRAIPKLEHATMDDVLGYLDGMDTPERMQGVLSAVKGVLGEFEAQDYFESEGIQSVLPDSIATPGYDVTLFDNDGAILDVVQVKTTSHLSVVSEHLERYPEIPVYVTEDVYHKLSPNPSVHELPFSSIDINDRITDALDHAESLSSPGIQQALDSGILCLALSTALNAMVLYKSGFSWDRFSQLTKNTLIRTSMKTVGAGLGTAFGPFGMITLGYVFGRIHDYYKCSQTLGKQNPETSYQLQVSGFLKDKSPFLKGHATEAEEIVSEALKISDFDGRSVYNLVFLRNFQSHQSDDELRAFQRVVRIPALQELVFEITMINEEDNPSRLPELAYWGTILGNACIIAGAFGKNPNSITQLFQEVLYMNGTCFEGMKEYIGTFRKQDGWEEWKRSH